MFRYNRIPLLHPKNNRPLEKPKNLDEKNKEKVFTMPIILRCCILEGVLGGGVEERWRRNGGGGMEERWRREVEEGWRDRFASPCLSQMTFWVSQRPAHTGPLIKLSPSMKVGAVLSGKPSAGVVIPVARLPTTPTTPTTPTHPAHARRLNPRHTFPSNSSCSYQYTPSATFTITPIHSRNTYICASILLRPPYAPLQGMLTCRSATLN